MLRCARGLPARLVLATAPCALFMSAHAGLLPVPARRSDRPVRERGVWYKSSLWPRRRRLPQKSGGPAAYLTREWGASAASSLPSQQRPHRGPSWGAPCGRPRCGVAAVLPEARRTGPIAPPATREDSRRTQISSLGSRRLPPVRIAEGRRSRVRALCPSAVRYRESATGCFR